MNSDQKCLVHGCTNRKSQGTFIGELCSPCHFNLTTGSYGPSNAYFVKDFNKSIDTLEIFEEEIKKLKRTIENAVRNS